MSWTVKIKDTDVVLASGENGVNARLFEGAWYFDPALVDMQYLKKTERTYNCPYKGVCYWIDLEAPDVQARNIAWVYPNPATEYKFIKDQIAFYARDTSGTTIES